MDAMTLHVKIKADEDIKRLQRLKRMITMLNPAEDIARYGLKRLIGYSPDSIKDGWTVELQENNIKFEHTRVDEKVLWFLELGTIAHFVRPKPGGVLHWQEDGKDFFSKGHIVSGIKPHLFFTRTMADMEDYANSKYGSTMTINL